MVRTEPPGAWPSPHNSVGGQGSRPKRADLKVTGGACPGLSAAYIDVSVVSPYHATRVEPLESAKNRRYQDKIVANHQVFTNFYPFVLSTSCSYHPKCSITFEARKAKGINVIKLKRSIAIGMLKYRATAYSVMYDGLRQRRSGVEHFFRPSQQSSTQATLAYAHARFSTVPGADLVIDPDWPMDTG